MCQRIPRPEAHHRHKRRQRNEPAEPQPEVARSKSWKSEYKPAQQAKEANPI